MEQTNNKRFKRIKTKLATIIVIVFMILALCTSHLANACTNTQVEEKNQIEKVISDEPVQIDTIQLKQQIQEELISEVSKYIKNRTSKAHEFIPKYIVQNGLANDIDICFMVAQTQIETTFGTAGIGRSSSKHSLFGVMSKRYSNYDHAIEDYCKILKRSYLVKGKTEHHLMKRFTTPGGSRYASNPNYEAELREAYRNVKSLTKIHELQDKWNRL